MTALHDYFGTLYRQDDPFGYRRRWYEARKRDLLLASLPRRHFSCGWELGCSNGELTAALAPRCDELLATDVSARAVELARQRTGMYPHVQVECAAHPGQWPPGRFDLIVFGEIGYYLEPAALAESARRMRASLEDEGVIVACHWLHPFEPARGDGRQVHASLHDTLGLPRLFRYEDADFVLEGWGVSPHSVAQREHLR